LFFLEIALDDSNISVVQKTADETSDHTTLGLCHSTSMVSRLLQTTGTALQICPLTCGLKCKCKRLQLKTC